MSHPSTDADVAGPRVDAAPRQSNVLRHGESWRSDELLSQPPKTYLGLGGSFCCALVLRIVVLVLAVVTFALAFATQFTKFYETISGFSLQTTDYYLWWTTYHVWLESTTYVGALSEVVVTSLFGIILSGIAIAMSITYLVLLCVHRSARVRDDEEAHLQYRARTQKLEEMAGEMDEMDAGAAPRSSAHRRAAEDRLRREAHDDAAGLYERERKRRHADRGVWFTLLFALLATFLIMLAGCIRAVVQYNNNYKADEYGNYGAKKSRMCEGVWLTLASWIMALVGFVLCVLRPCIRGQQETLTAPPAYSDMPHSQDLPTPSTRRGEFELYRDEHSPKEMPKSSAIVTGVPMQLSTPQAGGEDKLHSPPAAEHYATYYRE